MPGECCRPLRMSSASAAPIGPRSARGLGRQRRPWHDPRCAWPCRSSSVLIVRGYILRCVLAAREAGVAKTRPGTTSPGSSQRSWVHHRLPVATAAVVEEPTVDGTLKDFDWFHGPPRMPCYIVDVSLAFAAQVARIMRTGLQALVE